MVVANDITFRSSGDRYARLTPKRTAVGGSEIYRTVCVCPCIRKCAPCVPCLSPPARHLGRYVLWYDVLQKLHGRDTLVCASTFLSRAFLSEVGFWPSHAYDSPPISCLPTVYPRVKNKRSVCRGLQVVISQHSRNRSTCRFYPRQARREQLLLYELPQIVESHGITGDSGPQEKEVARADRYFRTRDYKLTLEEKPRPNRLDYYVIRSTLLSYVQCHATQQFFANPLIYYRRGVTQIDNKRQLD